MQHKKLPVLRHTCVGVDTIIGFYHNEARVSSTRSRSHARRGGRGGSGSDSCSQSDGQSGGVVPPRLPLMTEKLQKTLLELFILKVFLLSQQILLL